MERPRSGIMLGSIQKRGSQMDLIQNKYKNSLLCTPVASKFKDDNDSPVLNKSVEVRNLNKNSLTLATCKTLNLRAHNRFEAKQESPKTRRSKLLLNLINNRFDQNSKIKISSLSDPYGALKSRLNQKEEKYTVEFCGKQMDTLMRKYKQRQNKSK